jgi:hypothetical protein
MIVEEAGMMLVKFAQDFGNNSFPHEFRFVLHPELAAILIYGF